MNRNSEPDQCLSALHEQGGKSAVLGELRFLALFVIETNSFD